MLQKPWRRASTRKSLCYLFRPGLALDPSVLFVNHIVERTPHSLYCRVDFEREAKVLLVSWSKELKPNQQFLLPSFRLFDGILKVTSWPVHDEKGPFLADVLPEVDCLSDWSTSRRCRLSYRTLKNGPWTKLVDGVATFDQLKCTEDPGQFASFDIEHEAVDLRAEQPDGSKDLVLTPVEDPPYKAAAALPFGQTAALTFEQIGDRRIRDLIFDYCTKYVTPCHSSNVQCTILHEEHVLQFQEGTVFARFDFVV